MTTFIKVCSGLSAFNNFLKPKIDVLTVSVRGRRWARPPTPRKRIPPWLPKQDRVLYRENLTSENIKFMNEVVESEYGTRNPVNDCYSPLKIAPIEPNTEWTPKSKRTGVLAKKIGIYPMWLKNGRKVLTTVLQIADNHVIKYIPPGEWKPKNPTRHIIPKRKLGCLVVGAESVDPRMFTKEYCGLFVNSGVMPKRLLTRFVVSPDAALQPGTPLYAAHYKPGDVVDIKGKTIDRGFQGVCKRWGFKGMPASHGVTKTHRRPGNIGSGCGKARVMPGTKLPGHMGNRYRIFRGIRVLRVNNQYNVIWVLGQAIPGETNSFVHIYDTLLPRRKAKVAPHFPTYIPTNEPLPDELYDDDVHRFDMPSIEFEEQKQ